MNVMGSTHMVSDDIDSLNTTAETSRSAVIKQWSLYLIKRLGILLIVLISVSILTFSVTRFAGTPLYAAVGVYSTDEMIAERKEKMGLNKPLWEQYATYLSGLARGNLGSSRRTFAPVRDEIADRLPATAELVIFAVGLSILWAVPVGALAAFRPKGWADRIGSSLGQIGVSVPSFWLGLLFIYLLYYVLALLPAPFGRLGGADPPDSVTGFYTVDALLSGDLALFGEAIRYLLMPALTLSFTSSPPIFSVTRSAVSTVLGSQFVEAARSYGIPNRALKFRHVAPNAAPPVINIVAMTFGYLIGGAVLVEVVFSWPGIGTYAVQAMDFSDYDPVLGVVLLSATIYVVVYFLADLIQFLLDPRLRE